jgi:hypothetical protein
MSTTTTTATATQKQSMGTSKKERDSTDRKQAIYRRVSNGGLSMCCYHASQVAI